MRFTLGLLLVTVGCCSVGATTINFSTSVALDPSFLYNGSNYQGYLEYFDGYPSFTVQTGDVVTGQITFSNGSMSIQNPAGVFPRWADMDFFGSASTDFTSAVQLLGLSGDPGINPPLFGPGLGNSVLGADYNMGNSNQDFSFTGFSYTINVLGITSDIDSSDSAQFSFARLDFVSNQISVNTGEEPALPEPATWLMLGSGIVTLMGRKLRKTPRQIA